jgi:predicted nucleotidyltransferase
VEAVSTDQLQQIVDRLAKGLEPECIYLFGSLARGQSEPGSDIDLLVILPESDLPRHRREALAYDLLWGLSAPVDVIVLTRQEFQSAGRVRTSLASRVQIEGKLLYG